MRGMTFYDLNGDDYDNIMDYVEGNYTNPCPQDVFLDQFCDTMSGMYDDAFKYGGYGMKGPVIMHPYDRYVLMGNFRDIVDQSDPTKIIKVYFDCPIKKSPLLMFIEDLQTMPLFQLLNSIHASPENLFKSTKFNQNNFPLVIQVNLGIYSKNNFMTGPLKFLDKSFRKKSDILKESNRVKDADFFDIYDSSIVNLENQLENIYGINLKQTYEDLNLKKREIKFKL